MVYVYVLAVGLNGLVEGKREGGKWQQRWKIKIKKMAAWTGRQPSFAGLSHKALAGKLWVRV